jgi:hypothetical protein
VAADANQIDRHRLTAASAHVTRIFSFGKHLVTAGKVSANVVDAFRCCRDVEAKLPAVYMNW